MISIVIANTVGIYNELKLYLITIFRKILFRHRPCSNINLGTRTCESYAHAAQINHMALCACTF